jgi:chromosome segregation ATPase
MPSNAPKQAPESTDSLLQGFKELMSKIVPAVATAAVEPSVQAAHEAWVQELSATASAMQEQLDASLASMESLFQSSHDNLDATIEGFRKTCGDEQQDLSTAVEEFRSAVRSTSADLGQFAEAARVAVANTESFSAELTDIINRGRELAEQTTALLDRQETLNGELDAIASNLIEKVGSIHSRSEAILNGAQETVSRLDANFSEYAARLQEYTQQLAELMHTANTNFEKARASLLFGLSPRSVLVLIVILHLLEIAAAVLYYRFFIYEG